MQASHISNQNQTVVSRHHSAELYACTWRTFHCWDMGPGWWAGLAVCFRRTCACTWCRGYTRTCRRCPGLSPRLWLSCCSCPCLGNELNLNLDFLYRVVVRNILKIFCCVKITSRWFDVFTKHKGPFKIESRIILTSLYHLCRITKNSGVEIYLICE